MAGMHEELNRRLNPAPEERVAVVDDAPSGVGVEHTHPHCPAIYFTDHPERCRCAILHSLDAAPPPAPLADAPDDVEALAAALSAMDDMEQVGTYEGHARAILASDWLAARDADLTARAEAAVAERIAKHFRVASELVVDDVRAQRGDHIAGLVEDSFAVHFERAAQIARTVTSVEPGCTCGGMAACQQCQDRDSAAASYTRDGADGEADHG